MTVMKKLLGGAAIFVAMNASVLALDPFPFTYYATDAAGKIINTGNVDVKLTIGGQEFTLPNLPVDGNGMYSYDFIVENKKVANAAQQMLMDAIELNAGTMMKIETKVAGAESTYRTVANLPLVQYLANSNTGVGTTVTPEEIEIGAEGSMLIGGADGSMVSLPIGAAGKILTSNGTTAAWTGLETSHILIGDANNLPTSVDVYGDIDVLPTGQTMIGDDRVLSNHIKDGEVKTADLAELAVTTGKIENLAVTEGKIADLAVTTGKINDLAVTTGKIDDLAVTEGKIADLAVTTGKIAADAVTTAKIKDAAVTTAKIAPDAVTTEIIKDGEVKTADLADAAVIEGKIAADAVTTAKIKDAAVTTAKIAPGAVTTDEILNLTIVNEDVSETAAIKGTKIDPDFGAQNVKTTGNLNAANGTFSGTLDVTGATTLGTLYTSGDANVAAVTVRGEAKLQGKTTMSGETHLNGLQNYLNNSIVVNAGGVLKALDNTDARIVANEFSKSNIPGDPRNTANIDLYELAPASTGNDIFYFDGTEWTYKNLNSLIPVDMASPADVNKVPHWDDNGTADLTDDALRAGQITDDATSSIVKVDNDFQAGGNVTATGNVSAVDGTFSGVVKGASFQLTNPASFQVDDTGVLAAAEIFSDGDVTATGNVSAVDGTFSGDVTAVGDVTAENVTANDKLIGANLEIAAKVLADANGIKYVSETAEVGMGTFGSGDVLVITNGATAPTAGVIQRTDDNPMLFTTPDGGTTMNFTADKYGNVVAAGTLGVTGATTLASATVTGAATVGGTLGVTGATTLGVLEAGATKLASADVTGAATVGGTLGVIGNATVTGTLDVAENATFAKNVTATDKLIGANLEIGTLGTAEVRADKNGIKVTKDGVIMGMGTAGTNNLTGIVKGTAAAGVIQNATTNPTLFTTPDAGTTMNFTADTEGNVVAKGTLDVTGATTIGGTLGVTGNTTIAGTLSVAGATTLASATVTDAEIGNLKVTDSEAEFAGVKVGTLGVTGATTLAGTLSVAGATSLTNANVSGTLGVDGKANLADAKIGNLEVTDSEAIFAGVRVGKLVATGEAKLQGGAIVTGTLGVTGATDIAGLTTIGTTSAPANLVVNGDLAVTGTINGAIGSVNGTIRHSVGTADDATFDAVFAANSIVSYTTGAGTLTLPTTLPVGTQRTIVNSTSGPITVGITAVAPGAAITVVYVGTTWIQL